MGGLGIFNVPQYPQDQTEGKGEGGEIKEIKQEGATAIEAVISLPFDNEEEDPNKDIDRESITG